MQGKITLNVFYAVIYISYALFLGVSPDNHLSARGMSGPDCKVFSSCPAAGLHCNKMLKTQSFEFFSKCLNEEQGETFRRQKTKGSNVTKIGRRPRELAGVGVYGAQQKKKNKTPLTQAFGLMLIATYVNIKFPLTKSLVCVCVLVRACVRETHNMVPHELK